MSNEIKAHNVLEDCGILIENNVADFQRGIQLALSEDGKSYGMKAKEKLESLYSFKRLETTMSGDI